MRPPDAAPANAAERDGHAGPQALAGIDAMLAKAPHKDEVGITEAVRQLCILRDRLIAIQARPDHSGEDTRRLNHVNAVISVVLAVQFPLGEIPWHELVKAREWLEELVGNVQPLRRRSGSASELDRQRGRPPTGVIAGRRPAH